jgi:3-oxoacyl-[acyl-carrier-protein] synthase-3
MEICNITYIMHTAQPIQITATGMYVPSRIMDNDELATVVDTSDQWIKSHTGISTRHIADREEMTSTLALRATEDLLARSNRSGDQIDAIICATATPDYPGFPSVACILSEKLGTRGAALDVSAGCTGFIYALEVGRGLITTGVATNALIVGAERLSSVLDWSDRNTCVLFGDGAGAVLLERSSSEEGIIDTLLRSEGGGSQALTIDPKRKAITMDGRAVYSFAVRVIAETIDLLLEKHGLTIDQIDWIVPHQANSRIITACAKRYEIEESKFYLNIDRYANTSAASIPLALAEMEERGLLSGGQKIILVGFGAGLTYGGTLLSWR